MSNIFSQSASFKTLSPDELFILITPPMVAEDQSVVSGQSYLLVDLDQPATRDMPTSKPNCPVIGITKRPNSGRSSIESSSSRSNNEFEISAWVDLVIQLPKEQVLLEQIVATITSQPLAAATFVGVLRETENLSISQGLMVESLAYSTLQNSQGFRTWLSDRSNTVTQMPAAEIADQGPVVLVERNPRAYLNAQNSHSDTLTLMLNRPTKRNAFSAAMRDELASALNLALADRSLAHIVISGRGPSFCAGGDLTEFGQSQDAALAHLTRLTRSPANLIAQLREKILMRVHGACIGAGIELPAFANTISAQSNSVFALPEVGFGLIPGAGGTVSIPRRIGKQNTAKLGLSGASIDAQQALTWGLIDVIED
ncbi:enoyl-CoA hydratase/isomerase family protein [Pseudomonadales bacterium]|nr:enoyl-CoA hydratase/isomerase family protein [Pseudomonadales bacterium]